MTGETRAAGDETPAGHALSALGDAAASGVSRERERLTAELHDGSLQSLLAARQDLEAAVGGDREALLVGAATVTRAISELRSALTGLQPGALPVVDTPDSLGRFVKLTADRSRLEAQVQIEQDAFEVYPRLISLLVRELVINASQHAHARHLSVLVTGCASSVRVEVRDDGVGMPAAATHRGHFGLVLARQRVAEVHGTFEVGVAGGTSVVALLPPRTPTPHRRRLPGPL